MKIGLTRPIRDEKGQAMLLALILLLISGLVAAPLLSYTGSGLLTGEVYATRTAELYAADAGVEDAVWKIQNQVDIPTGCSQDTTRSYNITDVNGKQVAYNITRANNETLTYQVVSIATGNGSGTQVEAYITGKSKYGDYAGLLEHILTSPGEIDVANKVILDYPEGADPYPQYPYDWPEVWELEDFYGEQVKYGTRYYSDTVIDIVGINTTLGPLYVGGKLDILNSSSTPVTLTLNGTIYATGYTKIGTTGKDFTLDLAGQTIFASSNATGSQPALILGSQCTVKGPGVIIAIGDIEFKPKSQVGAEEGGGPVFILSVTGTSYLQPSGHIYGAIAGKVEVYVQQGEEPVITYPEEGFYEEGLNFLTGVRKLVYSIASWEVSAS